VTTPLQIIGQGLAGTCLAWELFDRGVPFEIVDREHGGSSRVAAGMINPVTGKNFQPSWRIAEFLPEAMAFYGSIEARLGVKFWHPHPVLRLAADPKNWEKIRGKLSADDVAPWVVGEVTPPDDRWVGAVAVRGGGRLDVKAFLDASRDFFRASGHYSQAEVDFLTASSSRRVWCEGAAGLLLGRPAPHRCAKGEILTLRAEGWDETQIRIGNRGWLIPIGGGVFKVGATYEWDELDELPTEAGRAAVEAIAVSLMDERFEVIDHEAGIRPILRRSEPLIGEIEGEWFFNGLGSKGSLYAPGIARRLTACLLDGARPEPELDLGVFLESLKAHGES
jgi:glycine/D-amino acid oxidase-like deaminating enzyme